MADQNEVIPGLLQAARTSITRQNMPEAIRTLREVLRLDPASPEAREMLAAVLCQDGSLDEGIAILQALVDEHPLLTTAHFNLASALRQRRQLVAAHHHLEVALRLDPHYERALAAQTAWVSDFLETPTGPPVTPADSDASEPTETAESTQIPEASEALAPPDAAPDAAPDLAASTVPAAPDFRAPIPESAGAPMAADPGAVDPGAVDSEAVAAAAEPPETEAGGEERSRGPEVRIAAPSGGSISPSGPSAAAGAPLDTAPGAPNSAGFTAPGVRAAGVDTPDRTTVMAGAAATGTPPGEENLDHPTLPAEPPALPALPAPGSKPPHRPEPPVPEWLAVKEAYPSAVEVLTGFWRQPAETVRSLWPAFMASPTARQQVGIVFAVGALLWAVCWVFDPGGGERSFAEGLAALLLGLAGAAALVAIEAAVFAAAVGPDTPRPDIDSAGDTGGDVKPEASKAEDSRDSERDYGARFRSLLLLFAFAWSAANAVLIPGILLAATHVLSAVLFLVVAGLWAFVLNMAIVTTRYRIDFGKAFAFMLVAQILGSAAAVALVSAVR